jgi:hypothetical protein
LEELQDIDSSDKEFLRKPRHNRRYIKQGHKTTICSLQEIQFDYKDSGSLQVKEWRDIYTNQQKSGIARFQIKQILDKENCQG